MEKKAVNKKTWIIIGVVVVLLAVLGVVGYTISQGNADRKESLLELGKRYLDELDYEQAVVCFEAYLEIDPQCVEAYAGLAQAYVGLGEYEKALEVLATGYAVTGEGSLQELGSRIEEQYREILMAEGNSDTGEGTRGEKPDEMAEATPEPEEEFVGPLVLDTSTVAIVAGNGGVVVTVEKSLYGAISYQGRELVPHAYNGCSLYPTNEGYFALSDTEGVHVFDAKGQEILLIPGICQSIYVSEGVVLYSANYTVGWYDIGTGQENSIYAGVLYRPLTTTQLQDGKFNVWCYGDGQKENEGFWTMDRDENLQVNKDTTWGFVAYPIFPSDYDGMRIFAQSDGYIPMAGGQIHFSFGLIDAVSGQTVWSEALVTQIAENYEDYGTLSNNDYTPDTVIIAVASEDPFINGYFRDGLLCFNKEMQMVYGDKRRGICYLLDFSKAKTAPAREGYQVTSGGYGGGTYSYNVPDRPAGRVTNLRDLIVAEYVSIQLSDSGYYLASDGESYFYLNERGQKVDQAFLDCGYFYNGYAIVLDTDGMAYLIDTEFNKVSEGYPADSVYTAEAIFCAVSGDQVTILTAP